MGRQYKQQYDENGNLIYYKDCRHCEHWLDSKGNEIRWRSFKHPEDEVYMEYDERGNCIHRIRKESGFVKHETWEEYDSENRKIYEKHSKYEELKEDCTEIYIEYDKNGNKTKERNVSSNANDTIWEYDINNNLVHIKNWLTDVYYKYDSVGNKVYEKNNISERFYEYDKLNNLIFEYTADGGSKIYYTYNNDNKLVYKKEISEYDEDEYQEMLEALREESGDENATLDHFLLEETWYTYDENGRLINKTTESNQD